MPLLPFAANTEGNKETLDDRDALPAGQYLVHIIKSEIKRNKANTGDILVFRLKVLDGPQKGRLLFVNLNISNPSDVAVQIARKELNTICSVCGITGMQDTTEVHGIPFVVKVRVKPGDAMYGPSNEITKYEEAGDLTGIDIPDVPAEDEAPPSQGNNQAPITGATGDTPAWAKK